MKLSWTTEKRRVIDLSPADYNPRQMTEAQAKELRKSLQKFGLVEIPAVDQDGTILAGHMRVATMIDLGMGEEMIDVRVPNRKLTDEEAMEYNLRSNKNTGEWDLAKLFAMPEGLLEEVGFSNKEIQKLVDGNTTVEEDDYDTDKGLDLPVRVARGEIWQLGTHRLMCGDSTSKEDVDRLMGGKKADICFTSPPYGAGNVAKLRDHYIKGSDKRDSFYESHDDKPNKWLTLMNGWTTAIRPYVESIFCNVQMLADNKRYLIEWLYGQMEDFVDVVVWDKNFGAPQMQSNVLTNAFEFIFIFGGNGSRSIPFADFHGDNSNIVRIDPHGKNENADVHKAVFPVALPIWVLRLASGAKTVVDPFLGTGSTLIACEQTGRVCYGMEIDPKYCTVILDRWEKLTGQKAIKIV